MHEFFFNDTATTEIYTLSLHDALPISISVLLSPLGSIRFPRRLLLLALAVLPLPRMSLLLPVCILALPRMSLLLPKFQDRKSTRLNSSHANISYAVFCLKKKYSS